MQAKFGWCSDLSLSYQRKCFYTISFRMKMGPQNERGWLLCTDIETNKSRGIACLKETHITPLSPSLAQVAPKMKDTMVSFISLMQRNNKNKNNSKLPPKRKIKHKEQIKEQAPPLSGEWKPASYVAVTAFVILALALVSGTAYDLFNRWVIVSNVNTIKPDSLKIKKLRHHLFFLQNLYLCPNTLDLS